MNFKFVGREGYYREGELYLLGQRWYDSEVGRFISRDPIGEKGGVNLYVYVGNNPIKLVDPYGLKVEYCIVPTKHPIFHIFGYPWIDHIFLKIDGKSCGFWPEGWPEGGKGVVQYPHDPHEGDPNAQCVEYLPPKGVPPTEWKQCFEDFCKNMQEHPPKYFYGFHDCRWFADKAIETCEKKFSCK